jgi:hypothetical protein
LFIRNHLALFLHVYPAQNREGIFQETREFVRTNLMNNVKVVVLALMVGLAACGDRETGVQEVSADSVPNLPPEPAAGLDSPPEGLGTSLMENLQGGAAGGEVTLFDRGGSTEMRVSLSAAPPDGEHPGHMHAGTCRSIGEVFQPLETIRTDSTGNGTMNAEVTMEPAALASRQLVVVYHAEGGGPLVCAEVPRPARGDSLPRLL